MNRLQAALSLRITTSKIEEIMLANRPNAWPVTLLGAALSVSVLAGCPAGNVTVPPVAAVPTTAPALSPGAVPAVVAVAGFSGQAMIGTKPLALSTVYVHDALANRAPVAPGTGNGQQLEFATGTYVTDAQGRFTIPLTVKPGQVAYIYVSNGVQAMSAMVSGNQAAYRSQGLTPITAANPLKVDSDSTITAGVLLGTVASFGKAATKTVTRDAAKLALIGKAIDAMALAAGKTSFKLQSLTKGKDIAESLATRMIRADPRAKAGPKPAPLKKKPKLSTSSIKTASFRTKADDDASDPGAAMAGIAGSVTEANPDGALDAVSTCANASEEMSASAGDALGPDGADLAHEAAAEISADSAIQDAEMAAGAIEGAPDLADAIESAAADASAEGTGADAGNTTDAPADAPAGDAAADSGGDDSSSASTPAGSSITVSRGSHYSPASTWL